jgi:hypothetical protein
VAPWVLAHSAHVSCALSKVRQLASVDRLNVKMFVSSTNLTADVELVVSPRRNVDAKNRKRMGDNVDPCEIPVEICRASRTSSGHLGRSECIVPPNSGSLRYARCG